MLLAVILPAGPSGAQTAEVEPKPGQGTIGEGIGDANLATARQAVELFQRREAEALFARHIEKARRRLKTPEGLAERSFRQPPCREAELLDERFTCYPEPTSELDPFCVYDRRVLCEGRRETTLFHVSLEPGSGALQRIQRIDTQPPSTWFWLGSRFLALVIAAAFTGMLILVVLLFVLWWIRRIRQQSEAWLRRTAETLGSQDVIVPGKTSKIEGQVVDRSAAAGIEKRRVDYYFDGRWRTRMTYHAWLRLDHPRPLAGSLRVSPKPGQSWLGLWLTKLLGREEPGLGDPRFDDLYMLQADDVEAARLLLATPHAGVSLAHRLIHLADSDLVLNERGVILRCRLAEAENLDLDSALSVLHDLAARVEGVRPDGVSLETPPGV